jgi:hypothetical protein
VDTEGNDPDDNSIYFDKEWLAITKVFNEYMPFENDRYDFSAFFPELKLYREFMNEDIMLVFKGKKCRLKIQPEKDFKNLLEEYKEMFDDKKWEFVLEEKQREYILEIIGIDDYYKNKTKSKKKNNEELIDIDYLIDNY